MIFGDTKIEKALRSGKKLSEVRNGVSRAVLVMAMCVTAAGAAQAQDITLTSSDDVFTVDDASTGFDSVDALDGWDSFTVDRTQDYSLALDALLNFELFTKRGAGALTVSGPGQGAFGDPQGWSVEAGRFVLDSTAEIFGVFVEGGELENNGEISAGATLAGDDIVFSNSGSIGGDGVAGQGARLSFTNAGGGVIDATDSALEFTGDQAVIINHGEMSAVGGVFEATVALEGADIEFTNTGRITAGEGENDGAGVDNARAVDIEITDGVGAIRNSGEILAVGDDSGAMGLSNQNGRITFTNEEFGILETQGADSIALRISQVTGSNITPGPVLAEIVNHGSIFARGEGSIGIFIGAEAGQSTTITNTVNISGRSIGILGSDGDETIINSGGITGDDLAADLAGGDDHFILVDQGIFGAADGGLSDLDGGLGFDTFTAQIGEGFENEVDAANVLNFEIFEKRGAGELTITGEWGEFDYWDVYEGRLTAGTGAELAGVFLEGGVLYNLGHISRGVIVGGDRVRVGNNGVINGAEAISGRGDGLMLLNFTGAEIVGDQRAVSLRGDNVEVANSGLMRASGGAFEATVTLEGADGVLTNSGAIIAGAVTPDDPDIDFARAVDMDVTDGFGEVSNHGVIFASGASSQGLAVTTENGFVDIINHDGANIIANGDDAIALRVSQATGTNISPDFFMARIENAGGISATGQDSIGLAVFSEAGQTPEIINSGVVTGTGIGVLGSDGDELLENAGLISGLDRSVDLGGGNDTVVLVDAGLFVAGDDARGIVDGGDGEDVFIADISEGLSNALDASQIINFEGLTKRGAGELMLSGDWRAVATWSLSGGRLVVGAGGALGGVNGQGGELVNRGLLTTSALPDDPLSGQWAVFLADSSETATRVVNEGLIVGGVYNFGDATTINNTANGLVNADTQAARAIGDDNTILNAGLIVTQQGAVFEAAVQSNGDRASLTNTGIIAAGLDDSEPVTNATGVILRGSNNTFENSGAVMALGEESVGVRLTGLDNLFLNSGRPPYDARERNGADAVDDFAGIYAENGVGVLVSVGTACDFSPCEGDVDLGSLFNTGLIYGDGEAGIGVDVASQAGQSFSIVNGDNSIIGGWQVAIRGGAGEERVILLDGSAVAAPEVAINLGAGDDSLAVHAGAILSGIADGGEGVDQLSFINDGDAWGVDLDNFVNWELLDVTGEVYFRGSGDFGLLTISEAGFLGGTSTLNGDLIINGTLAPGNSIGTITVNGAVTFGASSVFDVELAPDGRSDRLVVDGPINLGGTLALDPLGPESAYSVRTQYTLFTATGDIDGAFADITVNGAFDPYLTVGGGAGELTLMRQVDFTGQAGSNNALSAAHALNAAVDPQMEQGLVDVMDGVLTLNAEGRNVALGDLSGDIYPTQTLSTSYAHRGFAHRAARSFREGRMTSGAWVDAVFGETRLDTEPGVRGLTDERTGAVAGYDWSGERTSAGLSLAYLEADGSGEYISTQSDSAGLGAHLSRRFDAVDAGVAVSWMSHQTDVSRMMRLGGASRLAQGEVDATSVYASASLARSFQTIGLGGAVLRPTARLEYLTVDADAVAESQVGAGGLVLDSADYESLQTALGAAAIWGGAGEEGLGLSLHADLILEHGDPGATTEARFSGAPGGFGVSSIALDDERLALGAALSGRLGGRVDVSAAYDARLSANMTDHRAILSVGVEF